MPEVEDNAPPNCGVGESITASGEVADKEHAVNVEVTPINTGGDDFTGADPQEEAATINVDARASPPPSPCIEAVGGTSGTPSGGDAQAAPTDKSL